MRFSNYGVVMETVDPAQVVQIVHLRRLAGCDAVAAESKRALIRSIGDSASLSAVRYSAFDSANFPSSLDYSSGMYDNVQIPWFSRRSIIVPVWRLQKLKTSRIRL
jgi:hypothetical protein